MAMLTSRAARALFANNPAALRAGRPALVGGANYASVGTIWETGRCDCGRCFADNISCMSKPSQPSALVQQKRSYHEAVMDHFNEPRNVGKLDAKKKNVGSALVGKASCGDVIKLQIEVAEDGKTIKDAKFKTFGCGSAIASSSLATEMIIGQDLSEAEKLKNTDISSHLNLPPIKVHCSVLAEEAIQMAIEDYKKKNAIAAEASA